MVRGIPAERACEIEISAPGFATANLLVANRAGLDAAPHNQPSRNGRTRDLVVGPEFTHVGVPGLTIEGRVLSAGGKPAVDSAVGAMLIYSMPTRTVHAVTDADGRYRITGLPRGGQVWVRFGFDGYADFLPHTVRLAPGSNEALQTVDVELKSGIPSRSGHH